MIKRYFFVLMLMTLCIAGAWADEVTEKQAQDLANSFVNSYFGKKGSDRSGLKSQGQMEKLGFYVFNMTDKGGFVIVSNESETTPILGYSETGSIELDPDKMPENMRNWLQGYADEIAWLQKQENYGKIKVESVNKARTRAAAKQPITNTILTTRWNQRAPYNNMCPEYSSGKRAVTGCVATAMAQVMKYHQWPNYEAMPTDQSHLQAIPAYTTDSYKISLSSLPAVYKFDWANMNDTYTGSETGATADAVATLMKYCGYSVKMDYGPSSGSNSINVADALKNYYDYMSTTTCITRSFYSYDKWIEIIYNELAHNRPVVYGGQSSGGGHEFVCDGYKYENGTDYFHINWGWGGKSDEYYVLSSLNPYEGQGTGGSTSDDGFHYGQDAVVGIQPSNRTGDMSQMSDITPNVVDLTANSMTLSSNTVEVGTPVTVTINVTNNSSKDDYDGDIYIGVSGTLLEGNNFSIPAKQTRDCAITFTPTGIGTYKLLCYLPKGDGFYSPNGGVLATLTVYDVTPKGLTASEITSNSADLSWTQDGPITEWILAYKVSSADTFEEINIGTNPYTLTNLSPGTRYTVKVRPVIENEIKWSSAISFTTEAINSVPKDLTISEITPTTAMISWTGKAEATGFNLQYGVATESSATSSWLQYDDGTCPGSLGTGSTITWGVMYPGNMVKGNKLTKVKIYETDQNIENITIKIYSGGANAPGTWLYTEEISPLKNGFHEVTLAKAVNITPGENLWITLTESGVYPVAFCECSEPNNQWVSLNDGGTWKHIGDIASFYSNNGWMIRAYLEVPVYTTESWTTVTDVASPYQLTGLKPGKNYLVQVQAVYQNGTSDWCESSFFTTPSGIVLDDTGNNTKVITETAEQTDNVVNVSLTNRTLYKDCAWNTLCVPFDMTSGQINADGSPLKDAVIKELDTETEYNFGDDGVHKTSLDSGGKLYLNFKTAENIEAGKPYIVKWATTGDPIINPMFNGVTVKSTAVSTSTNSGTITSVNSQDGSVSFIGTYKAQTFTETDGSVLFFGVNSEGKSTLYYPKPDLTDPNSPKYPSIGAQRAYFKLSAPTSQVRGFELNFGDEEQTTGILDARNKIENRGANEWYDLSGRKLSGKPTQKGVYVQNGRKVVIK